MPTLLTPYNLATLEPYTGEDAKMLTAAKRSSPYWATPKQAWAYRVKAKAGETPIRIQGERTYNVAQLSPLPSALTALLERHQLLVQQTPRKTYPVTVKALPVPVSLQHYIKSQGGIDPDYNHGQWREELRLIRETGSGLVPGLLTKRAGKTIEEMAETCRQAGYILECDVDELLFALSKDVEACATGDKLGRVYGHGDESYVVALAEARYAEQFAD